MDKLEFEIYQARNGGVYLQKGNIKILLDRRVAEKLYPYDLEDFNVEDWNKFYFDTLCSNCNSIMTVVSYKYVCDKCHMTRG